MNHIARAAEAICVRRRLLIKSCAPIRMDAQHPKQFLSLNRKFSLDLRYDIGQSAVCPKRKYKSHAQTHHRQSALAPQSRRTFRSIYCQIFGCIAICSLLLSSVRYSENSPPSLTSVTTCFSCQLRFYSLHVFNFMITLKWVDASPHTNPIYASRLISTPSSISKHSGRFGNFAYRSV